MSGRVPMWRRYLRLTGDDPAGDVDDELRFHVEERTDELVARGMDRDAARAEAVRRLGDLRGLRRELTTMGQRGARARRRREAWTGVWRDARLALRRLRAEPVFAAIALATLALGVGASVAIFTVVNAVLLRPLPYRDADRLVALSPGQNSNIAQADALGAAPALAASTGVSFWDLTLTGAGDPTTVGAVAVDAGYFAVFGVRPALGRPFRSEERDPGRSGVAILSDALWRTRFGADRGIIGRQVRLDGYEHETRTVVGVMPRGFVGWGPPGAKADVWIPLSVAPGRTVASDSTWYVNWVLGRLAPGATVAQAATQVRAVMARLHRAYPGVVDEGAVRAAGAASLLDSMVGDVRGTLWILLAAVGLVLALACANLANLLLARGERRRQELAVRAALGAARTRLIREQLTESLVLAVLGGALGVLLARAILAGLRVSDASGLPRVAALAPDARVLGFALATSLLALLAFGLLPALRATGGDLRDDLGAGTRNVGQTRSGRRLGFSLVALEVALATVLVAGAALLLGSLHALRSVDPGLDVSHVLTLRVSPPDAGYTKDRTRVFWRQVRERLDALPGVRGAGAIQLLPFDRGNWAFPYLAQGHLPPSNAPLPSANFRVITPGYRQAVGMRLLEGRDLGEEDRAGTQPVMLINRRMARELWPRESAVGKTIRVFGDQPFRVVGVVGDVHQSSLDREPQPEMYVPLEQWPLAAMTVMVRASGDPAALAGPVRRSVWSVDPTVPVDDVRPLAAVLGDSMTRQSFFAGVLSFFGALALLLGAVGVYGVMAHAMAARRSEYGIRVALGATRGEVLRGALAGGLAPIVVGLLMGVLAALAGGRVLRGLLYGIAADDPRALTGAVLVLAAVATAAIALPAWRLTRLDAARVLRAE